MCDYDRNCAQCIYERCGVVVSDQVEAVAFRIEFVHCRSRIDFSIELTAHQTRRQAALNSNWYWIISRFDLWMISISLLFVVTQQFQYEWRWVSHWNIEHSDCLLDQSGGDDGNYEQLHMFDFLRFGCQQILRTNDASDVRTMHATSNRQAERNQLIVFLRFYVYHHSLAAHTNHLSGEWRAHASKKTEPEKERDMKILAKNEIKLQSAQCGSAQRTTNGWPSGKVPHHADATFYF